LYFCAFVGVVSLVSSLMHRHLLLQVRDGLVIPESEELTARDWSDLRELGTTLLRFFCLLMTAVFVLRWIYRAAANTRTLYSRRMRFTPGWAVGWFFIPIAHLWKPYQAMRDLWVTSASNDDWPAPSPWLLPAWWCTWIAYLILDRVYGRLAASADEVDAELLAQNVDAVACVFFIGAGILLASLIARVQTLHEQRAVELQSAEPGALDGGVAWH
jgi:hypothetical protein